MRKPGQDRPSPAQIGGSTQQMHWLARNNQPLFFLAIKFYGAGVRFSTTTANWNTSPIIMLENQVNPNLTTALADLSLVVIAVGVIFKAV